MNVQYSEESSIKQNRQRSNTKKKEQKRKFEIAEYHKSRELVNYVWKQLKVFKYNVTHSGLSFYDGYTSWHMVTVSLFYCGCLIVAVQATAICCSQEGLECTYMQAGPSGNGREDRIEVSCPDMTTAVGK